MRNSNGVFLVYDINNFSSFEKLDFWLKQIKQVTAEDTTIYLLGNKLDLVKENPNNRKVEKEFVSKFVIENNINYWIECSAKNKENLSDTFEKFYLEVYMKHKGNLEENSKTFTKIYKHHETGNIKNNCC